MIKNNVYETISQKVRHSTNEKENRFVGISYKGEKLIISLPIGFEMAEIKDNDNLSKVKFREDLKLLLFTIKKYYVLRDKEDANSEDENSFLSQGHKSESNNLPIFSYDYIVKDFISKGYYYENEIINKKNANGRINWKKTIETQKSYCNGGNFIYLDFVRKKSNILRNELITQLHKTCVYESFNKWGFMYVDRSIAEKPKISIDNAAKFIPFLKEKLSKTFNDRNRTLFKHMIKVIEHKVNFSEDTDYRFGVTYFHPVWEKMIDRIFGIENISKYYPSGKWYFIENKKKKSSNMREDTIMEYGGLLYVLDAKYYGKNRKPSTADINKQITYGKTVEDVSQGNTPYNSFLLPANLNGKIEYFGYATINSLSDYKFKQYGKVAGIYYDTKKIMQYKFKKANENDKLELASLIKSNIDNVIKKEINESNK